MKMSMGVIISGITTPEQRAEMLEEAVEISEKVINLAKSLNLKPAQLVLACCNILLTNCPSVKDDSEIESAIFEMSAGALVKVAQIKGFIGVVKLNTSTPEEFFREFITNLSKAKTRDSKNEDFVVPEANQKFKQ